MQPGMKKAISSDLYPP